LKTNEYSSKKVRPKFRKQEPILTRGVMYMHSVKLLEERVGLIRLNSFTRHLAEKKNHLLHTKQQVCSFKVVLQIRLLM